MALLEDLENEVEKIFEEKWTTRNGTVVPNSEDIKFGNEAVKLNGTVLYADLSGSTNLVDTQKNYFATEIYKSYLHSAAKIIRSEGGIITAYDGDRIMAVYLGNSKNTCAGKTAFKINYTVFHIINPAIKIQYPNSEYQIEQVVGIDTSELWVAKTGIRGSNDLVWVGRAANYAAKLSSLNPSFATNITKEVYEKLHKSMKISNDEEHMWNESKWSDMNSSIIYRSNWWWGI